MVFDAKLSAFFLLFVAESFKTYQMLSDEPVESRPALEIDHFSGLSIQRTRPARSCCASIGPGSAHISSLNV